ncbi:type II toxin-antitoxin system VapC family toxin [Aquabacterium sp.]|uniref:type II toxin-antitoxin system VapC family toxin n=1 Tax=Aquabacterium sp. TaxID=1872578 RepID=UPI002CC9B219|nr:PIN domain-containing protein [Aquabacterium sp.]HSW03428.1 PIN domain-containing protein [Aquabacterium sp.]
MIAVDSGFLYALLDADDAWHARAKAQVSSAAEGWVTTWPVLAETCHLLMRRLGADFAAGLMQEVAEGGVAVWSPGREELAQVPALMRKYAKLPMDLADATLVLLAEHLGHGRIMTTDQRDFGAHRWKNRKPFHNLMAE